MTRKRETISIPEAANILKIGARSIYRYIDKGILNKSKTGKKSYLYLEEVTALQNRMGPEPAVFIDIAGSNVDNNNVKKTINLDQQHYEALLIRLGQLEAQKELLLEYKTDITRKDLELRETRNWFEESLQENKQVQEKISHLEEKNNHLKSSSIFTLQKRASEIEELRKSISALNKKIQDLDVKNTKLKKRNIFERIFNLDE